MSYCINKIINSINLSIFLDTLQDKPVSLPIIRPDPEKANPKLGVGTVLFSHDNIYMSTRNGNLFIIYFIINIHYYTYNIHTLQFY